MNNEYNFLKKQRYEYYKGTTEIVDNEVDELVEDVVDVLNQKSYNINELLKIKQFQAERIAELKEQLKNAIRFKTPQVERFAVVQYIHWEKKPYKIVNCFDAYKDENMKTRYCFYGVPSTNFKVIEICDTKAEAQAKLKELKGENK